MPRLDKTILINAPVKKVYEILDDFMIMPRWNIVVQEISELEKDKYFLKTNVGDVTNIVVENVPNEKMTSVQEGSPMDEIGYIFNPQGDDVEVTLWATFELEDQRSVLDIAADLFLKSLKVYVDYISAGGDPESYVKKFSKIKKA
ncbi:MAG: hypothetical protein GF383_01915 [Candidatus Lokiarchaeota archaeon]|nr:hypothetical protein [Candidatus Lokiarchaeota archaeon]MBD3338128.1 hypothetical protein [Candidatus Lokiarchaeota archaeon]